MSSGRYEARLAELGITLPPVPQPRAAFVPAVQAGNLVFSAGHVPIADGHIPYKGKVGRDLSKEEGYEAARLAALNALAAVRSLIGSLDRVERVVKLLVFVNADPDFTEHPHVGNGASELILSIFGDAGQHARSSVGMGSLPRNAAVEVEMIVQVR